MITSALPYINGVKHLGNLAGSMLPADVYARFKRAQGHKVLFICATDEHGTPAELSALSAQQPVEQYCHEQHKIQADIYNRFGLSFDWFGRSSSAENHLLTQHFASKLEENGWIEERSNLGLYCLDDQRFLPDRYVLGTCPFCSFARARGDQCDGCGKLLDPLQLKDPFSSISGSRKIEKRETKHLYLQQSKLSHRIENWINTKKWGKISYNIAKSWLAEGIEDRAITRDLQWGVPIKNGEQIRPGFENKRFYVWFDAPIEYISATQEWSASTGNSWKQWWDLDSGAQNVEYTQFMGKDNVAFHAVSFPATILGSGEPWKTVDTIKAMDWLNWYGSKFSTSEKRGIFMDSALDILPSDFWRWTLMAHLPETSDVAFTLELLQNTINADLCNSFGNLVSRLTRFCFNQYNGKLPSYHYIGDQETTLFEKADFLIQNITQAYSALEFRRALEQTRALFSLANTFIAETAPWAEIKRDPARAGGQIYLAISLLEIICRVSAPVIPSLTQDARNLLPVTEAGWNWPLSFSQEALSNLKKEGLVNISPPLVEKIRDEKVQEWKERFGGGGKNV